MFSRRFINQLYIISFFTVLLFGQSSFSVQEYKDYLNQTANMDYGQLSQNFSAGYFSVTAESDINAVSYMDSVDRIYHLTEYEKKLLWKHSFMVTERISPASFIIALDEIYDNDLPLYISSDAILNAVHMSYDEILKRFEIEILIPKINNLLNALHQQMAALDTRYAGNPYMLTKLQDLDLYLTIPRHLLAGGATPFYDINKSAVNDLLQMIRSYNPAPYSLFAENCREIDFSQFQPRGHYTDSPELTKYFRAMMWLGRIEVYLTSPAADPDSPCQPSANDITRQLTDAVLVCEAIGLAGNETQNLYEEVEQILLYFIGESDNVTLSELLQVIKDSGLENAAALNDSAIANSFQDYLVARLGVSQKILSHILYSNPFSPDQIAPATAFLLFGQRFVIDSYVMGNVVYDRVLYNGQKVRRMLPSSFDVLFALGNDAVLQLLQDEMEKYPYASSLAANRYLIDAYDAEFWQSSLYNSWLQAIRTLAPARERQPLPAFMQTAAWGHKQINTQLTSWAQLRHDNLLYAKQSYTGGILCDFPATLVEPVPEFYKAMADFAGVAQKISDFAGSENLSSSIKRYFNKFAGVMDTLQVIAQKELDGIIPDEAEKKFLKRALYKGEVCGRSFDGWYPSLNYPYMTSADDAEQNDMVIADVHTAPTDESGAPAGWVKHIGSGPLNMAVVISDLPTGEKMAFTGPVISYYEHVTTNFKRLTDEEWLILYDQEPSFRPDFVNLYLADDSGQALPPGQSLLTNLDETGGQRTLQPTTLLLVQNYPNPFNGTTTITFSIPASLAGTLADLTVFDVQGRQVRSLLHNELPAGSYSTRWDGLTDRGTEAASGLYFYRLSAGSSEKTGKMLLAK